jgi:ribosomal protein S27E
VSTSTTHGVTARAAEVDCPDCFDTMIKIYSEDNVRYQCENCDLAVGSNVNAVLY